MRFYFSEALECLKQIAYQLLYANREPIEDPETEFNTPTHTKKNQLPISKGLEFILNGVLSDSTIASQVTQRGAYRYNKNEVICKEVNTFSNALMNLELINKQHRSADFWNENSIKYPNLTKLYRLLSTINSSSAFIERFFSQCGIIRTKRNQNMNPELFNLRAFLVSNIKILDELCSQDH